MGTGHGSGDGAGGEMGLAAPPSLRWADFLSGPGK